MASRQNGPMYHDGSNNVPVTSFEQKVNTIFPSPCVITSVGDTNDTTSPSEAFKELNQLLNQFKGDQNIVSLINVAYEDFVNHLLQKIVNYKKSTPLQNSCSKNADTIFHRHIGLINLLINQELQSLNHIP